MENKAIRQFFGIYHNHSHGASLPATLQLANKVIERHNNHSHFPMIIFFTAIPPQSHSRWGCWVLGKQSDWKKLKQQFPIGSVTSCRLRRAPNLMSNSCQHRQVLFSYLCPEISNKYIGWMNGKSLRRAMLELMVLNKLTCYLNVAKRAF